MHSLNHTDVSEIDIFLCQKNYFFCRYRIVVEIFGNITMPASDIASVLSQVILCLNEFV